MTLKLLSAFALMFVAPLAFASTMDTYECRVGIGQVIPGTVIQKNTVSVQSAIIQVGQTAKLFPQTSTVDLPKGGVRLYIGYGPGSYYGVSGEVINVTVDFLSDISSIDPTAKIGRISATAPMGSVFVQTQNFLPEGYAAALSCTKL